MHPFLNIKDLSDNQLYDKVSELSSQSMMIRCTGNNEYVLQQIELTLAGVYAELEERATRSMAAEMVKAPDWDMDDALAMKRKGKRDAESENKEPRRRRWRPNERQRGDKGS